MHLQIKHNNWHQLAQFVCAAIVLAAPCAAAQEANHLARAKQLYQSKQYKEAAGVVRAGMYKGVNSAAMWLLLAECYQKQGQADAAKQAVDTIIKYFPGTTEAAQAKLLMGSGSDMQATVAGSGKSDKAGARAKEAPLDERVNIVPPKFGHPEVSSHTVTLVKSMVRSLPINIYKIMNQAHVMINVTPNLIDRFPDAVQFKHPTLGHFLSDEYGRTYGKDIYICERVVTEPGGTVLQSPLSDETIKSTVYTQFSHALDCCLEFPSRDRLFLTMYRQDLEQADRTNADLRGYTINEELGTNEVFGGLAAGMMGNNTHITQLLETNFPRCKAWIKARIDAIAR
jgi:tetratricopeptide (TPR) repeat protein